MNPKERLYPCSASDTPDVTFCAASHCGFRKRCKAKGKASPARVRKEGGS